MSTKRYCNAVFMLKIGTFLLLSLYVSDGELTSASLSDYTEETFPMKEEELDPDLDDTEYTSCVFNTDAHNSRYENCPGEKWISYSCANGYCLCCKRRDRYRPDKAYCNLQRYSLPLVPLLPTVKMLLMPDISLTSKQLTKDFFQNVPQITHLFLPKNKITTLDRQAFTVMKNLKCLNLNENNLTVDAIVEALLIPGLDQLSTSDCFLPPLPNNMFRRINSTVTLWVFLDNPHAYDYDMTFFSAVTSLQSLCIDYCDFRGIYSARPFLNLTHLALNYNSLDYVPNTCTDDDESLFPNLKQFDLIGNHIQSMGHGRPRICMPNLEFLNLYHNSFYAFPSGMFNTSYFPRLNVLYLDYPIMNMLTLASDWQHFSDYAFQSSTLIELHLVGYDLEFRDHKIVSSKTFAECPNLEYLNLSKNNFRGVNKTRFFELFGSLQALKILIIEDSEFELMFEMPQYFPNLTGLNLRNNLIFSIPNGFFDPLKHLEGVDLSNNKITNVNEQTFGEETRKRLEYINLGQNPFLCTCQLVWFTSWFKSDTEIFLSVREKRPEQLYQCSNLANVPLSNFSMVDQACLLSEGASIQIIVLCFILILSLTVVSLMFRYRWHMRLLIYEAFRGQGDARRRRLLHNVFDFDVFLSYASEEHQWVDQHLMQELENHLGLRVCFHERDFIPGKNIVDNIVDCVVRSKKIVMVFSRHFVLSQWCQFELAFCLSHVMDYDDALIIVCVDDVVSRDMTSSMMAVLKTTTYIQWLEDVDAIRSFWARIGISLQEIMESDV